MWARAMLPATLALALSALGTAALAAQSSAGGLTLREALRQAWERYPRLEAAKAQVAQSQAEVVSARDAYLPRTSIHAQSARATRNNVLGMMLPNQTIAPISGLVPNGSTSESTWSSAAGVLFSWTAYDFGARGAAVRAAEARQAEMEARVGVERYTIGDAVADAFFRAAAAAQAERAAEASVARWRSSLQVVDALVAAGLRPGADASRLRAELARAEAFALQAQLATASAKATLSAYLSEPERDLQLDAAFALEPYAGGQDSEGKHPLLTLRLADLEARNAEAKAEAQQWLPKVDLYSAAFGRGTGARIDGSFRGGAEGLYPDTGNWAVGVGFTVDLFDWKRARNRSEVRQQGARIAEARSSETELELRALQQQARLALATNQAVATKTPVALQAARELLTQSEVRYRTGLGDLADLAEAQRTLQVAEVEDAVARVNVWRAAFALAAAQGRMEAFADSIPARQP